MELDQLRQLDAIDRFGTVSAAADSLHISQPSVSRSVRALERELGQELFDRTRNRMELNEAGLLAVQHARAILAEERRMLDAFDELSRKDRTILIGAVAPAPVWNLTAKTVERFPGTILSPTILPEDEVERRLLNRTIDLAITSKPMVLPTMLSIPIMTEDLFAFVPSKHPLAGEATVSFDQLDGETFLVDASAGIWKDMVRRNMPHTTFVEQEDRAVFGQLVRTTELFSFITDAIAYIEQEGDRVRVPIADADAHMTFFLTALLDAQPRVREIMDWMRQHAS